MDWFMLLYILLLAGMLSVLIAAHEYGHFLLARLYGMEVEEFAIGFGPKPWTYMVRKGTKFTLRPIPFGGFVRVKGMMPEADGSETKIEGGFYSKSPFSRLAMLFAGPLFSILAGLVILIPLHSLHGVKDLGTVVDKTVANGPASKAGIQPGDRVVRIDGQPVRSFFDMTRLVRDRAGEALPVVVERNGQNVTLTVVPELEPTPSPVRTGYLRQGAEKRRQAKMGIYMSPDHTVLVRVPIQEAVTSALMWPVDMTVGLVTAFTQPSKFKESVGGPGTIVSASYQAAKRGWDEFVQLAALLSISLGIFNLLPIPPLDGGQMLVAIAEMARKGKRLSIRVQEGLQSVGFLLLIALIVGVIVVDVQRFTGRPDPPEKPPTATAK